MGDARASTRPAGGSARVIQSGHPIMSHGPAGGQFVGWVLVEIWNDPAGRSDGVSVNWSGPSSSLFGRAASKLDQLSKLSLQE